MGIFDTVIADAICPRCGQLQPWRIQYKYGYCRSHEYTPGDAIGWFDPPGRRAPLIDAGENVGGLVAVAGAPESGCRRCGVEPDEATVWFRDNVVESIDVGVPVQNADFVPMAPPREWLHVWSERRAGRANEDRLEASCRGRRWTLVVADGAGGLSGGALAARWAAEAASALGAEEELTPAAWCERLSRLDREMEADSKCGETTLVVVQVSGNELWGASIGDSGALLVEAGQVVELTAMQKHKPLLGSGACTPTRIERRSLSGRLLLASDGLLKYLPRPKLSEVALAGDVRSAVEALVEAVKLPSGNFHDDVAVILAERARGRLRQTE
ncbi:protein phosphatase 2C domain-containing protein [Polyangium sp. 15x6]|uniref:protein phosphatase 2C domain-containing protein n=1 Tax=Polyangium sp. 15x6 TaxID=3042687 RepID=UPI00249C8D4B|nr:protein phosphatase 2C domain-containing protein [Polyangium sp. 15x6]MDI3285786.1 protein phosphatase 2C domain-containing protein [Polyangium sp. 15x6]